MPKQWMVRWHCLVPSGLIEHLKKDGDFFNPTKGAWRSFEHGARNCIGQELTMIEIKIVMVVMF